MEDWRSCPACKKRIDVLKKELEAKYGRVTKEEYTLLQEEFERAIQFNDGDATMKIEYEYFWDDEANAVMKFTAKCDRCKSIWTINTKDKAKINNGGD